VWFVVSDGFLPNEQVSVVARVECEFVWRVADLPHVQVPWFDDHPSNFVPPCLAVAFLAVS
jgi:hypothetical protein